MTKTEMQESTNFEQNFENFCSGAEDALEGYLLYNLDNEELEKFLEPIKGDWETYNNFVVLNVKGKGQLDRELFKNKVSQHISDENEIYELLYNYETNYISEFFDDVAADFAALYMELHVLGRSGGYWGFDIKDFIYSIKLDIDKLKTVFDNKAPTLFADADDDADGPIDGDMFYEIGEELMEKGELDDCLYVDQKVAEAMGDLSESIDKASEYYSSAKAVDEAFEVFESNGFFEGRTPGDRDNSHGYYEDEYDEYYESKKTNRKRVRESGNIRHLNVELEREAGFQFLKWCKKNGVEIENTSSIEGGYVLIHVAIDSNKVEEADAFLDTL